MIKLISRVFLLKWSPNFSFFCCVWFVLCSIHFGLVDSGLFSTWVELFLMSFSVVNIELLLFLSIKKFSPSSLVYLKESKVLQDFSCINVFLVNINPNRSYYHSLIHLVSLSVRIRKRGVVIGYQLFCNLDLIRQEPRVGKLRKILGYHMLMAPSW